MAKTTPTDVLHDAYRWLTPCHACETGQPAGCTCETGNPRPLIWQLVQEVEDWREMAARSTPDARLPGAGKTATTEEK